MILYNVTVKIDLDVHEDWLNWMKQIHIPDVLKTNLFVDHKMLRLLNVDEDDGITYSIQYFTRSLKDLESYQNKFAFRFAT